MWFYEVIYVKAGGVCYIYSEPPYKTCQEAKLGLEARWGEILKRIQREGATEILTAQTYFSADGKPVKHW